MQARSTKIGRVIASVLFAAGLSRSAERLTATGKVVDAEHRPIEHAMVLVHSAGVKKGYNLFCPICYVDCGKRAITAADGTYRIAGLSPDLVFNFLVVRDGYSSTFVNKIDPEKAAEPAVLKKRISPNNPKQIVRGKVVDSHGTPVRDALVEQQGAISGRGTMFGDPAGWIDLVAVTNDNGEFEIAHTKPLDAMILQVSPRAMAAKLVTEPTGLDRKTIVVTEGSTIRGRLVENGRPVGQAEVGLSTHNRAAGRWLPDMSIGTTCRFPSLQ